MPGIHEDRDRQVVPIWRSFETTIIRGELTSLTEPRANQFTEGMLTGLMDDWAEQRIPSVASDLISVALTLGLFGIANDAADFLLAAPLATDTAKSIARTYLAKGKRSSDEGRDGSPRWSTYSTDFADLPDRLHAEVRESRRKLIHYPRNPILWINLARLYTSLGVQDKATKAMHVALSMAAENRFVVRCAARLLLHQGNPDHAHWLLRNSPNIKNDPWILAAEIAVAAANEKQSKYLKVGRKKLESKRILPFHLSELASAIGTVETKSGNLRTAKELIRFSLESPTENALAQAAWLTRKAPEIGFASTSATFSFEANAWLAWRAMKWETSLEGAALWHIEQPFSSRPAIFGSYIASMITDNFELAATFAKQGLLSNPDDITLHNNLAFALAMGGDVNGATKILQRIEMRHLAQKDQIVVNATKGLVAFRLGQLEEGRRFYRLAIVSGENLHDIRESVARIYLAFEELRARTPDAETRRNEAIESAKILTEPPYRVLTDRLKNWKA